jgi:hypothetical protein
MAWRDWVPKRSEIWNMWPSPRQFRVGLLRVILILVLLTILGGGLEISLQLLGINITFPEEVTVVDYLSVISPMFLSAALVYLYYQQKEILSAEHRSMVSVNRSINGDDDEIEILVSNSGSGSVYGIFLKVELEFEDGNISGGENLLGLRAVDESGVTRSFVKPYEASALFKKKLLLPVKLPNDDDYRIPPFHSAMNLADRLDTTEGHLTLTVVWEDAIQTGEIEIFDEDFDVVRDQSFEEFIHHHPMHSMI